MIFLEPYICICCVDTPQRIEAFDIHYSKSINFKTRFMIYRNERRNKLIREFNLLDGIDGIIDGVVALLTTHHAHYHASIV